VDLGNPLLVPQRAWIFEAGYEHRLPQDKGTLGAKLFYRYFRDGVVFVPYGYNSAGLPISARGNLPTPNFVGGVELNAAVRLTALGLPGAQLNARLLKNVSETIDAFTDTKRKGSSAYYQEYSLGFRHDITRWKAAYGVDYLKTDGPQIVSDVRNYETQTRGPRVNLFAEKTLSPKYAIRLEAYGVNSAHEIKSRRIYAVSQRDGALSRLEAWDERRDRRFVVKIRGKF
jgi:outer membrane receptor protein involved in Fe transport